MRKIQMYLDLLLKCCAIYDTGLWYWIQVTDGEMCHVKKRNWQKLLFNTYPFQVACNIIIHTPNHICQHSVNIIIWYNYINICTWIVQLEFESYLKVSPKWHDIVTWILVNIGSGNGLLPVWWKAITWTTTELLSIGILGTKFSEILIKMLWFWFVQMPLNMSSAKMSAIFSWLLV